MLSPVLTTPPAETPVSLAEAKAHLNVVSTDDDALIVALIEAATAHLDGWSGLLGRALVTQTWRVDFRRFPSCGVLDLPLRPISAVTGITYYDTADAQQTLATSVYAGPFTKAIGPYVSLRSGQSWPSTYAREDAVSVTFTAGYGNAAAVPAPIKAAILLMVGNLYANREAATDRAMAELPLGANALLSPYKVGNI